MSESYNYIKVKSQKELEKENKEAKLIIHKAGTHHTMPGGTHMPIPRVFPYQGVAMPGTYDTPNAGGDSLRGSVNHNWTPSAGIGGGSVGAPPLFPRKFIAEFHNTLVWDPEMSMKQKTMDVPEANRRGRGFIFDAANHTMPGGVDRGGGSVRPEETEGSVGQRIRNLGKRRGR